MGRGKSRLPDATPLMCSSASCRASVLGFLTLSPSALGWLRPLCLHSESPQDSLSRAAVVVGWLQRCWSTHVSVSRSVVSDSAAPRTVARQAPLSTGFSARTLERVVLSPPGHLPASAGGALPLAPPAGAGTQQHVSLTALQAQSGARGVGCQGQSSGCQSCCRSLLRTWKPSPSAGVNIKL